MDNSKHVPKILAAAFSHPFRADSRVGGGEHYNSGEVKIDRDMLAKLLAARLMTSTFNDPRDTGVPYVTYTLTDKGKEWALDFIRNHDDAPALRADG